MTNSKAGDYDFAPSKKLGSGRGFDIGEKVDRCLFLVVIVPVGSD